MFQNVVFEYFKLQIFERGKVHLELLPGRKHLIGLQTLIQMALD